MAKSRSVWSWGKVFELVTVSFHIYCMCRCKLIFKVTPFSVYTLFCYVEITTYASACSRIFIGQSLRLCQSALHLTQEARVALGYASSNSCAFFVLSKLPVCFTSSTRWLKIVFLEGFVC